MTGTSLLAPLPVTMRHVHVAQPGDAGAMSIAIGPTPVPKAGEVLIQVAYAGVNRPDILQRSGAYPPPSDASPVLGLEVAGRIVACGTNVERWRPGDIVCALTPGGGYAEYCATPAGFCLPVPERMSLSDAASLPETFFTVWNNLFDRGHLVAGESVLIHGGTSGIGITAIQLARAFGATVFTTVGSVEKAEFCRKLGAHHAIVYRDTDFVAEISRITTKRGVDVILDIVGGDYIPRNLRVLAADGRLVMIGFMGGTQSTVDWRAFIVKRQTITGSTLRASPESRKVAIARSLESAVWARLSRGEIRPVVDRIFGLDAVADAHRLMESSTHAGKILLAVSGAPDDR